MLGQAESAGSLGSVTRGSFGGVGMMGAEGAPGSPERVSRNSLGNQLPLVEGVSAAGLGAMHHCQGLSVMAVSVILECRTRRF